MTLPTPRIGLPQAGWQLPLVLALAAFAGFIVTIDRVPVPWADEILYASTARAMQLDGTGVPTVLRGSPAVDHVGFYGPVYFGLAAAGFDLFGFSISTFRAVGVLGAVIAALATAWLAAGCGHGRERQCWAACLMLLTPDLGSAATNGRMDALTGGLLLLALASFVHGLSHGERSLAWGATAGACLAGAALSAPRAFPFVAVFILCGLAFAARGVEPTRTTRGLVLAAAVALASLLALWGTFSHGSPLQWMRVHLFVALRENVEIAALPGAARDWNVTPWHVVTPVAAAVGGALAIAWRDRSRSWPATGARFALAVTAFNFAVSSWILNFAFALGPYVAVPALAGAVAAFPAVSGRRRVTALTLLALLVAADAGVRAAKYIRVAATWEARDPRPLAEFVARHVPAGSTVFGPYHFYFYAVEGSGSRFLAASGTSIAAWPRWFPQLEPRGPSTRGQGLGRRFLIWPLEDVVESLPAAWSCPGSRLVATFDTPPDARARLGPLARLPGTLPDTYHETRLYALPPECGDGR